MKLKIFLSIFIISQILISCGKKDSKNNIAKIDEKIVNCLLISSNENKSKPTTIVGNEKKKVAILDVKNMTPFDLYLYSGTSTMGYVNQDKWQVTASHGYAHLSNPFFKEKSDKKYALRVEYEIAAHFDASCNQDSYAFIHVMNNQQVIHSEPINNTTLGGIDRNGNVNHYQKIVFTVKDIAYAHNLQPRLFLNNQYNKKIYIKSVTYFLVKQLW